jgi:predicted ferric reductase
MVREPLIVNWCGGLQRMYRWHHAFGMGSCGVLLAHPAVLAASLLPADADRALHLLSPARWFPSNALGWAALLGLMVGLSAALVPRMRYATWRRLHFCMSLAVLLGLAHVFALRGLSAGLLLTALPSIGAIGWRVFRADRGLGSHPYEVRSVMRIASDTTEVVLRPLAARLSVRSGQVVMVAFFEGQHYQGCGEFHPYTVCESRSDGSLVLAIKALGDCTTQIQSLEEGVAARVQGPMENSLQGESRAPS